MAEKETEGQPDHIRVQQALEAEPRARAKVRYTIAPIKQACAELKQDRIHHILRPEKGGNDGYR